MNQDEQRFFESQGIVVEDHINAGKFGVVYSVFSSKYNEKFALKKIKKEAFNLEEIECLKKLDDVRVLRIYDYFEFQEHMYILMEYCTSDLQKLISESKYISRRDLHHYISEIVQAVKACHDRGIAHCDIKPSNFLIDKHGRVKISDFGLSDICSLSARSSTVKGTPMFMAPEILKGQLYNPIKADIWALGITIYFLATGTLPFVKNSIYKLIESICEGVYTDGVIEDPLLRNLIAKCIDPNIKTRATAEELLNLPYFSQFKVKERNFLGISKNKTLLNSSQLKRLGLNAQLHRHSRLIITPVLDLSKATK